MVPCEWHLLEKNTVFVIHGAERMREVNFFQYGDKFQGKQRKGIVLGPPSF